MEPLEKRISIFETTVFLIILILLAFFIFSRYSLKKRLQKEKIKYEVAISDKHQSDKVVERIKKDLIKLAKNNDKLESTIEKNNFALNVKNIEIEKLQSDNSSVQGLRKNISELESFKVRSNKEVEEFKLLKANLNEENIKQNELILNLQQEANALKIANAVLASKFGDKYRIEAYKGKKERLTIAAKKTNKIMVYFELPSNTVESLYFELETPAGEKYSSKDHQETLIKKIDQKKDLLVDNSLNNGRMISHKSEIKLTFQPSKKLEKGIYNFSLFNDSIYIGSTCLNLK